MDSKIKNLEFLRVVAALAIVWFHLFFKGKCSLYTLFPDVPLYHHTLNLMTYNGQKAVDLFFILSGFFFAFKLNTTYSLLEFIKKKIQRLYPVLIFVLLLSFIISLFGIVNFNFYDAILTLLGLSGTTLMKTPGETNVGQFWYCSALLWVMGLYFYLLKTYNKKNVNLFIAVSVFVAYSIIVVGHSGRISNQAYVAFYIFKISMLRAFGGIGLGYFIGEWYRNNINKIENLKINIKQFLCITIFEFMCLYFIINNLMLHKIHYKNDMIFIATFVAIIILFLCKKGFISKFFDNNIWASAGKYTYSIFMTHALIRNILANSLWIKYHEWIVCHSLLNIFITIILFITFGIFTYHFVEQPCADYFKQSRGGGTYNV